MDAFDMAAAQAFQTVRSRLETGPWNTGELGGKGFVVTEPRGAGSEIVDDGIARYTDRYLSRKTIGRTTQDFPFNPQFLPTELHRAAGLEQSAAANGKTIDSTDPPDRLRRLERLERLAESEAGDGADAAEEPKEERDEDDENPAEAEDEFEELDDDDYNAEKYFDDGEDFGEGDDGDDEAAY